MAIYAKRAKVLADVKPEAENQGVHHEKVDSNMKNITDDSDVEHWLNDSLWKRK